MSLSLTTQYPYQPAMPPVCYLCGAPPRTSAEWPEGEPIIHTGKYIEMEGWLHICGSCWTEGSTLLGWKDTKVVSRLEGENISLRAEITRLEAEISAVSEANGVLVSGIIERSIPAPPAPEPVVQSTRPPVKHAR